MILNSDLKSNLIYGVNSDIDDQRLIEFIHEFKLFNEEKEIDLYKQISNKSLSTGQMQKISFIRALLSGSEILLLDESTSNLDFETKVLIFDILKKRTLTIINATHNADEFLKYEVQIQIVIKDGRRQLIFLNK